MKNTVKASKNKAALVEILGINNPKPLNILLLVVFAISLGWFGDTTLILLQATLNDKIVFPSFSSLMIGILPFPLLLAIAYKHWKNAQCQTMKLRATEEVVQAHEGVILFLSNIQPELFKKATKLDMSIFDEPYFPWMQNSRGLEPHRQTLQHVWVICSSQSEIQFSAFKSLLSQRFPNVTFEKVGSVAFDDVEAISHEIENIFDTAQDIDEVEIIIDITSGTKISSIAGMMASIISDNREIQYVKSEHEVKRYGYDISIVGKKIQAKK